LCGLLHDFGNIVLPAILRAMRIDIEGEARIRLSDALHPAVGYYVASSWQLPDIVLEAVLRHHGPFSLDASRAASFDPPASAPSPRIGDLIAAAEWLSARHGLASDEQIAWPRIDAPPSAESA